MKKRLILLTFAFCLLSASCGSGEEHGAGTEGEAQAAQEAGAAAQSFQPVTVSGEGASAPPDPKKDIFSDREDSGQGEETWETEEVLLSDKVLSAGDTLEVMYPDDEGEIYPGLSVTLHSAELFDSPEAAGLDRAQMLEQTENYSISGEPEWCGIDGAKLLVCDLTVENIGGDEDGEEHISELMIAYADPDTGKVSMVSCAPAYFPASISQVGASDYYHYDCPRGESREMTVVWAVQKEAAGNLYLCVTYDVREPKERQYFRLTGQE